MFLRVALTRAPIADRVQVDVSPAGATNEERLFEAAEVIPKKQSDESVANAISPPRRGPTTRKPAVGASSHKAYVVAYRTPDKKLLIIYDVNQTTFNNSDDNTTAAAIIHPANIKGCK